MPTYVYDCCGSHLQIMSLFDTCPQCGSTDQRNFAKTTSGLGDKVHGRKWSIFGLRNYQDEHLGWVGEDKASIMKEKGVRYARGLASADCWESDPS